MELAASIYLLQFFDDVTTGSEQALIHKALSQFRVSALRDSYDEESRVLIPPSPNI